VSDCAKGCTTDASLLIVETGTGVLGCVPSATIGKSLFQSSSRLEE
jgi:hypothetical protein